MAQVKRKNEGRKKVIYKIVAEDGTVGYVGQTVNLGRRRIRHIMPITRKLRNVDKWMESQDWKIVFTQIEECDWHDAGKREQHWKRTLKPVIPD